METKGDIISLKGFVQGRSNKSSDVMYEERKRHLINEFKKGRDNRLMPKEKKQKIHNTPSPARTSSKAKTRKITIGWMHRNLSQDRYVSVRATKGGGTLK